MPSGSICAAGPLSIASRLRGHIPATDQLPGTAGNAAGLRRLHDIVTDPHLPDAVRGKFMTELRTHIEGMKDPPQDLHAILKSIAYGNPDAYLRKGLKGLTAQSANEEMGGLRRALSLKWLCANCTDAFMKRAHEADRSIPPVRPPVAQRWLLADKLVQLIKSGKLDFDPISDVDGAAMIGNFPTGASAWFFAGQDVAENLPPPALKTQLAVGDEYKEGYQIVELPHEMAAPNEQGEGGAAKPTALDLCLAPEGKLNENLDEPFGRTSPTAPGQVPVREVVLAPIPLSAVKRGPLVMP